MSSLRRAMSEPRQSRRSEWEPGVGAGVFGDRGCEGDGARELGGGGCVRTVLYCAVLLYGGIQYVMCVVCLVCVCVDSKVVGVWANRCFSLEELMGSRGGKRVGGGDGMTMGSAVTDWGTCLVCIRVHF